MSKPDVFGEHDCAMCDGRVGRARHGEQLCRACARVVMLIMTKPERRCARPVLARDRRYR